MIIALSRLVADNGCNILNNCNPGLGNFALEKQTVLLTIESDVNF